MFLSPDVGFAGLDLGSGLVFEPGLTAQHFVWLFWGSQLMEKSQFSFSFKNLGEDHHVGQKKLGL